jgi:hypothetical protein
MEPGVQHTAPNSSLNDPAVTFYQLGPSIGRIRPSDSTRANPAELLSKLHAYADHKHADADSGERGTAELVSD